MAKDLLAGVARTDITPPLGVAHTNWGAQTHERAAGVDLPLWATALALSDGETTAIIVEGDMIGGRNAPQALEAIASLTGLPRSHIRLSYSHTHSGPSAGRWAGEGADMYQTYMAGLAHRLAGVAWAAIHDLRPARIAAGHGACHISVNRRFQRPEDGVVVVGRNWAGPVDPEVQVIRVDDRQGQPLAAIVNYACHGTTVGPDSDLITPDYPGMVRRVVEQSTSATCLFLQGAAGNVQTTRGLARGGIDEYRRLGAILGHEASRIWWEMELPARQERYLSTLESGAPLAVYADEPLPDPDATLRVAVRPLSLPLKSLPDPEPLEAELEREVARLNHLRSSVASGDETRADLEDKIRTQTMVCKRLAADAGTARRFQGQTHDTLELQVFAIGDDIALVAVPGELFVEIGLVVKRDSPFKHTLFSGYSNEGGGYLPIPEAYPLGGYEVDRTPYSPEAAGQVIADTLALLHDMARA
jgi:hypothetical protein